MFAEFTRIKIRLQCNFYAGVNERKKLRTNRDMLNLFVLIRWTRADPCSVNGPLNQCSRATACHHSSYLSGSLAAVVVITCRVHGGSGLAATSLSRLRHALIIRRGYSHAGQELMSFHSAVAPITYSLQDGPIKRYIFQCKLTIDAAVQSR